MHRRSLIPALALAAAVALVALAPRFLGGTVALSTALVNLALPLLIAGTLLWFAWAMCLAPRVRLKRLRRIRTRQGRRHPLA
jgi:hypothetical protein